VAAELAPVVQARGNQLEVEVGAGDPVVSGDRARLRQILVNLVGNAAKFTDGGVVRLVVSPERDLVVASVQDTGIGFAPELLEKLFQPYERAPGVGGREGTGLGLAIVRRLVQVLGGRLVVTSALGEGSTFALRLPRRFPGQA
jgi:signal transduction histidine kinase